MTDRELLEAAAKAAGIALDTDAKSELGVFLADQCAAKRLWNPLTDDGDAFRLAVDLGLNVYPVARTATGQACSAVGTGSSGRLAEVVDPSDTRAATRRAIVRAAAAMAQEEAK